MTDTDINLIEYLQQPEPEFATLTWRFAKTMASSPHAYVVRSLQNEDEYAKLSRWIAREGSLEDFSCLNFVPGPFVKAVVKLA